jgi:hypothetical protein
MTTKLLPLSDFLAKRDTYGREKDFEEYTTAVGGFSTVASDSGTVSVADGVKGIVALVPSDGTVADNDETYMKGTNEVYKFANDKPLRFEALVQFTEANTDDANVIVGFKDAVAADTILDNGAGPAASYSGAVFFKVDGDTYWQCEVSIAGTQQTGYAYLPGTTTKITAGGSAYQRLRIEFQPMSSTVGEVRYWIDGVLVKVFSFTYTNATEMQECFGVKNGAGNLETLNVDYVSCKQVR